METVYNKRNISTDWADISGRQKSSTKQSTYIYIRINVKEKVEKYF